MLLAPGTIEDRNSIVQGGQHALDTAANVIGHQNRPGSPAQVRARHDDGREDDDDGHKIAVLTAGDTYR